MAQTLLGLDLWFRWHGSSTAQKMTRWAKTMRFSYGSSSLSDPRDGRLVFDNRDGRFTPRGKSLVYPREVLTTPTPFFVSLASDVTAMLVSGVAVRVDAQDTTAEDCVWTLRAKTAINLQVQPRYGRDPAVPSGTDSLLFFDALAISLGTERDPNRTRRPPTDIEGVIEWPPVVQIGVQSGQALFPVVDAVADWTDWSARRQDQASVKSSKSSVWCRTDIQNGKSTTCFALDQIVVQVQHLCDVSGSDSLRSGPFYRIWPDCFPASVFLVFRGVHTRKPYSGRRSSRRLQTPLEFRLLAFWVPPVEFSTGRSLRDSPPQCQGGIASMGELRQYQSFTST